MLSQFNLVSKLEVHTNVLIDLFWTHGWICHTIARTQSVKHHNRHHFQVNNEPTMVSLLGMGFQEDVIPPAVHTYKYGIVDKTVTLNEI